MTRDSPGTLYFSDANSRWWATPFPLKFALKETHPISKTTISTIFTYSASIVKASEKCSISINRKSTKHFPTSQRWTVYVTRKSRKGWHKRDSSVTHPCSKRRFRQVLFNSAAATTASAKSSIITNRRSTMRFPSSHRWTPCVHVLPLNTRNGGSKREFFGVEFHIFVAGNRRHFKFGMWVEHSMS